MDKLISSQDFAAIKIDTIFTDPAIHRGRIKHNFGSMERSDVISSYPKTEAPKIEPSRLVKTKEASKSIGSRPLYAPSDSDDD